MLTEASKTFIIIGVILSLAIIFLPYDYRAIYVLSLFATILIPLFLLCLHIYLVAKTKSIRGSVRKITLEILTIIAHFISIFWIYFFVRSIALLNFA
jgi:hypothetical protein